MTCWLDSVWIIVLCEGRKKNTGRTRASSQDVAVQEECVLEGAETCSTEDGDGLHKEQESNRNTRKCRDKARRTKSYNGRCMHACMQPAVSRPVTGLISLGLDPPPSAPDPLTILRDFFSFRRCTLAGFVFFCGPRGHLNTAVANVHALPSRCVCPVPIVTLV